MNKVCVVTWYGGTNYGTNLQAYALVKKLSLMGYDAKIKGSIRKNTNYFLQPYLVMDRIRCKLKNRNSKDEIVNNIDSNKKRLFEKFIDDKLPKLNSYGKNEWKKIEEEYIAFVTGSDQVWNPNYFQGSMMLDFVVSDKIKKIAYAPSIGVNSLSAKSEKTYKRLLKTYSAISVREEQGAKLLSKISPVDIEVVLDPTMLLTCNEWDELASEAIINDRIKREKYIVCYFVGDRKDYIEYVKKVQLETGLECIVIPINNNVELKGCITLEGIGPNEFIWLIKHAQIVLTDSFHASVFSILYHKEFYVLKRFPDSSASSQNSRLHQILGMYELSNRWIEDESSFMRESNIDYSNTDTILQKKRNFSETFLKNSLEKGE